MRKGLFPGNCSSPLPVFSSVDNSEMVIECCSATKQLCPQCWGWLSLLIWNNTVISYPLCCSHRSREAGGSCGSREVCDIPGIALQAPVEGAEVWAAREDQRQNSFLWGKMTSRISLQF